ncbi:winged helix-turn-helix transcriptional regulator [Eubacterium maltosivorans]|uniref:winged helix-turn-helix transcriptional regulator n=1 Tax=Eubacterium maltosivorans TaxID=2041044 RepID=UPI003A908AA6
MILDYVKNHGLISNKEARELLGVAESTTKRFLSQMVKDGLLVEQGERKARVYVLKG